MRFSHGLLIAAGFSVAAAAPALAGKKKKKEEAPKAPVSFKVENACKADLTVALGTISVVVKTGATTEAQSLPVGEDLAFPILLKAPTALDLGLVQLTAGGNYLVRVSNCTAGGANLFTTDLSERPAAVSPNAAAQVRFRARQNGHLEYRSDTQKRDKRLSIAMTDYKDAPAGDFKFQFRLRAARKGPVLKMLKDTVKVSPAKRYLIESNVVNNEIHYKIEDEGWIASKK